MACGLALLASGQSFAATYYSKSAIGSASDFTIDAKWTTLSCTPVATVSPLRYKLFVYQLLSQSSGTAVAITPDVADSFTICSGRSLTLAATDVLNFGTLVFKSGSTWTNSGVLKFGSGNKTINNENSSLATIALNVSSMTSGNTITIAGGSPNYLNVTFSSVTGGSLSCASSYPATITAGTTCTVTIGGGIVNAPIDLHFSKQVETFATEIELK